MTKVIKKKKLSIKEHALYLSILEGDYFSIIHYINFENININTIFEDGKSGLIIASEIGNINVISAFISKGSELNYKDNYGNNALYYGLKYAFMTKDYSIPNYLIKKEIEINETFAKIVEEENIYLIHYLLTRGADINYLINNNETVIQRSINNNSHTIVIKMLKNYHLIKN